VAAKKASAGAGAARRPQSPQSPRAAKQPEGKEDDSVKPGSAARRAKGAKAAKTAGSGANKARRTAKPGTARKSGAATEKRRKRKAPTKINGFAIGDYVVYPAHGVGRITGIDERAVADQTLQVFVVAFVKDKMTLLVPTDKVDSAGMRRLSSRETMDAAITTLKGRARTRRVMWSRRAQEYEAKLNSGDPVSIAEVVRDLHRNVGQPDQSYSERQMYEAALDRLAREFAAVDNTDTEQAANRLEDVLRAA
jgi:CarD family transcriptional regulator